MISDDDHKLIIQVCMYPDFDKSIYARYDWTYLPNWRSRIDGPNRRLQLVIL